MSREAADRSGLPGPLPEGESLLWQGSPSRSAVLRDALHVRGLAAYLAAVTFSTAAAAWQGGGSAGAIAVTAALAAAAGLAVIGFAVLLAALVARTTVYTITNKRLVMRIGIALPMTLNIPFAIVASAGLRESRDGTGDIPLTLAGKGRVAYLVLWPHARPWRLSRPEPMLRGVPQARQVATVLSRALGSNRPIRAGETSDAAVGYDGQDAPLAAA